MDMYFMFKISEFSQKSTCWMALGALIVNNAFEQFDIKIRFFGKSLLCLLSISSKYRLQLYY